MTRVIEFDHCGQAIRAIAVFKFETKGCSVAVLPVEGDDEFGDIVLFRKGREWTTDSRIKSVARLTYFKLLYEVDCAIIQYKLFSDVDAQKLLS